MRKPPADTLKFMGWATATILAGGGLIASAWPAVTRYAHGQSATLVAMGDKATGTEASLDYRLADALDHTNQVAAEHYASDLLSSGDAARAAKVINRSGGVSVRAASAELAVRANLETGDLGATRSATSALANLATTDSQLVTLALGDGAIGQGSNAAALVGRVSSPEALRRVKQAASGNVALAQALSASGLVRSSRRELEKLPSSPPRDLMLARFDASSDAKADWRQSANLYAAYLTAVPADTSARLEYASILDRLKNVSAGNTQRSLAARLTAGQP